MLVSITPLGTSNGTAADAAHAVVNYLEGKVAAARSASHPKGARIDATGYYADSLEGPGRWTGRGTTGLGLAPGGVVERDSLEALLVGRHPSSHIQLLSAQGSAARRALTGARASRARDDVDVLSFDEASIVAGVTPGYLRRVATRTSQAVGVRVGELLTSQALSKPPDTLLFATREGREWRVTRSELARFVAARKPDRAVIGYDATWSAPKSVSVLWATAGASERAEIRAAVDAAVDAGIGYLEGIARPRSGTEAHTRGLTAAAFTHATSRNLDPQLHVHAVIANLVQTTSGKVRAVDGRTLFAHAKTAGYLAAAELRHELTRRLGWEWGEVVHGLADVVGVPRAAIAAMSSRKHEIDSLAIEAGVHSASGRQIAAYQSRNPKADTVDPAQLRRDWQRRLEEAGFDATARAGCFGRQPEPRTVTLEDRHQLVSELAGAHGVTEQSAIFDRRDVIQHVAEWAQDRLAAAEITDLADAFLASQHVVALDTARDNTRSADVIRRRDGHAISAVAGEALYSTPAVLRAEQRILDAFAAGIDTGAGAVPDGVTAAVVAERPGLGADQVAVIRAMCGVGDQFQCVLGPAGSGKTFAIEAARAAWEAAGFTVLGAAEQGTAAEVLGRATGMRAETLEYWLTRLDTAGPDRDRILGPRTVIVVDEASTISTRNLARLCGHARATGATVRLVGDVAQHSAVAAGGAFRALVTQHRERTPELTELRRQAGEDLAEVRVALREYRHGQIAEALERLEGDQRIVEADSADELLDKLVADWYVDRQRRHDEPDLPPSSMVAEHHRERRELNRRARALLAADGHLHGPTLSVGGQEFRTGDEVISRTPAKELHPPGLPRGYVRNGTRGAVIEVRPPTGKHHGSLVVDFEARGPVEVPAEFLARSLRPNVTGGLTHAYALTSHAAQGETYDAARTLASDTSTQPGIYVGLTRGRRDVRLYTVRHRDLDTEAPEDHMPRLHDQRTTLEAITQAATRSLHERMATSLDPDAAAVAELRARHDLAQLFQLDTASAGTDTRLVTRAIIGHADAIGRAACLHPPAHLVARLGARPPVGHDRDRWDTAVSAAAVRAATTERGIADETLTRHGLPDAKKVDERLHTAEIADLTRRPTAQLAAECRSLGRDLILGGVASSHAQRHYTRRIANAQHAAARADHDAAEIRRRLARLERARPSPDRDRGRQRALGDLQAADVAAAQAARKLDHVVTRAGIFHDDAGPAEARHRDLQAALAVQIGQAAYDDALDPPRYITGLLGPRPSDSSGLREWDRRALLLEYYRHLRCGLAQGQPADGPGPLEAAIGPRPENPGGALAWDAVRDELAGPSIPATISHELPQHAGSPDVASDLDP